MTEEEWKVEVEARLADVAEVCQSVIDDNFELVRVQDNSGKQFTGFQLPDGRVPMLFVPEEHQTPLRGAGETLQ